MTQEGEAFINNPLLNVLKLTNDQVARQIEKVREELVRRDRRLRRGRPFPRLQGRTVILVDDAYELWFDLSEKQAAAMLGETIAADT